MSNLRFHYALHPHWPCLLGTLILLAAGCTSNQGPVAELIDKITPASPREVASDAFDVDPDTRRNSVAMLSAAPFGGEEPYLRLYRLLITDQDDTVRAACVKALGLHGTPEDVTRIIVRMTDDSAVVRWQAAQALQKIHSRDAIDPLTHALAHDDDADVRQAAAEALGQYPQRAVFNALVQALEDPQYGVAAAARRSLATLTGYDFATETSLWMTYAKENPDALFEHQQQYTWMPFDKPPTFIQRFQFWKRRPKPQPQLPTGYDQNDAAAPQAGS